MENVTGANTEVYVQLWSYGSMAKAACLLLQIIAPARCTRVF
jgi:hypothetical protein